MNSADLLSHELDLDITETEILTAVKKLNTNKACGQDGIFNEYFINCKDISMPCLLLLFNNIFKSGYFPSSWSLGNIVPVFKKGDVNNTDTYRGITLLSCAGKLFTAIINERLVSFEMKYNKVTDAQFGFRKNSSTVDAIFALQSLVNRTLKKKKTSLLLFYRLYKSI